MFKSVIVSILFILEFLPFCFAEQLIQPDFSTERNSEKHNLDSNQAQPSRFGSFQTSLPLILPEARSNFGPQFQISYDSNQGDEGMGLGWSLNIPSITLSPEKRLSMKRDKNKGSVMYLVL
jgi:hypothetical protein